MREMLIVFAGLPATGKSELASRIGRALGAPVAHGQSAIVDAVNAVEPAKDMWRRLAARRRGVDDFREPTWEEVEKRRLEYTAWTEPLLPVDSVDPIESNVARVMEWIRATP